jgi:hypothetical protein
VHNAELLIVKAGGTYSYHWASKGYTCIVAIIKIKSYSFELIFGAG